MMEVNLQKTIVLIGLMGAGKSSIGVRLADKIGVAFRDSDHLIEEQQGVLIAEIFKHIGEQGFRELEYKAIAADLKDPIPHVLATGGGAFMQEETRQLILDNALVVWLRADLDILVERVSRKNTRPLLEGEGVDKSQVMQDLMDARYLIYAEAHCVVESDDAPHADVVERVIQVIREYQKT